MVQIVVFPIELKLKQRYLLTLYNTHNIYLLLLFFMPFKPARRRNFKFKLLFICYNSLLVISVFRQQSILFLVNDNLTFLIRKDTFRYYFKNQPSRYIILKLKCLRN